MANEGFSIKLQGCVAAADYRTAASYQYRFVYLTAARTVTVCSDPAQVPIGVLQNTPNAGMPAEVIMVGETKIAGYTAITAGQYLATDGSGYAISRALDTDGDYAICGQALDTTGAQGGLVTAVINCINPPITSA